MVTISRRIRHIFRELGSTPRNAVLSSFGAKGLSYEVLEPNTLFAHIRIKGNKHVNMQQFLFSVQSKKNLHNLQQNALTRVKIYNVRRYRYLKYVRYFSISTLKAVV